MSTITAQDFNTYYQNQTNPVQATATKRRFGRKVVNSDSKILATKNEKLVEAAFKEHFPQLDPKQLVQDANGNKPEWDAYAITIMTKQEASLIPEATTKAQVAVDQPLPPTNINSDGVVAPSLPGISHARQKIFDQFKAPIAPPTEGETAAYQGQPPTQANKPVATTEKATITQAPPPLPPRGKEVVPTPAAQEVAAQSDLGVVTFYSSGQPVETLALDQTNPNATARTAAELLLNHRDIDSDNKTPTIPVQAVQGEVVAQPTAPAQDTQLVVYGSPQERTYTPQALLKFQSIFNAYNAAIINQALFGAQTFNLPETAIVPFRGTVLTTQAGPHVPVEEVDAPVVSKRNEFRQLLLEDAPHAPTAQEVDAANVLSSDEDDDDVTTKPSCLERLGSAAKSAGLVALQLLIAGGAAAATQYVINANK